MYELKTPTKKIDDFAQKFRPIFNVFDMELYDLDNPEPYGLDGGTNYDNTEYYVSSFYINRFSHEWINTDRWVSELSVKFSFNQSFLRGEEKWESYDTNKLVDLVEEAFKIYIDNILSLFGNEIRTDKKNRFWSEKEDGYIFSIDGIDEELKSISHQKSKFTITQSSLYKNGKDELCYFRNGDKSIGKVPVKYAVVDKQVFIDKVRKDFIKVANRFLSQDYNKSVKVPQVSDIVRMSREELLAIKGIYDNKTVWLDVIKK